MLKLGYKASAEQFGPLELLRFSRLAEETGFDSVFISDHFQPWKHHGGHAPFSLAWLGALGAVTSRIIMGTSVLTPDLSLPPGCPGAGFRHARRHVPRPDRARRRDRGIVERRAVDRHGMAGIQGALRAFAGGRRLDPPALERGARDLRRSILSYQGRDDLRPARRRPFRSMSRRRAH